MPSSAMGMPDHAMGLISTDGKARRANPDDVRRAMADLGEMCDLIQTETAQAIAQLAASTPGLKVCLAERLGAGELMLWVGPGVWSKLAELTRSKTESEEPAHGG